MSQPCRFYLGALEREAAIESDYTISITPSNTQGKEENEGQCLSMSLPYLIASTCGLGGLQVVWSVVLSHGAPFLMSMGLSKSLTCLVWIAGPICGVVVQPLMAAASDRSRSSWGRRRPFIVSGTIGTIISMIFLAWLQDIVQLGIDYFATCFHWGLCSQSLDPTPSDGSQNTSHENCPRSQQQQASAWASRTVGVGNIIGYLAGLTDLSQFAPSFSVTQFQGLCLIASISLAIGVSMSCIALTEKPPPEGTLLTEEHPGFSSFFRHLLRTYKIMPWKIRRVCYIQFWAWMAWFPFNFYSTTYISDLYGKLLQPRYNNTVFYTQADIQERGLRIGSFASLLFAIVALLSNLLLPFAVSNARGTNLPKAFQTLRPTVLQAWTASHIFFAIVSFATVFVTTITGGIVVVSCLGISWALTLWAPFTIIGIEIATIQDLLSSDPEDRVGAVTDCDTGTILSLHNIAISAPQIFAALVCSGVFWLAQLLGSSDSTSWTIRVGGISALVAAWLSRGLSQESWSKS